jgi:hypothetical protein
VHTFCGGGGGGSDGQSGAIDPPSMETGRAHSTVPVFTACASHVQSEGQLLADEQVTTFGVQCEVESVMVMQTVGSGGGTGPPSAEGALPPPEQDATTSGSHVKPSPQSDAALQGSRYLGTQDRVVVCVQLGVGVGSGVAHFPPGGQAGVVATSQVWLVWVKHTIPDAQSPSEVQGKGAHWEIVCGLQIGCTQVSPGAHAIAGHGVSIFET